MQLRAERNCLLCGQPGRILHEHVHDRIFSASGEWSHRACRACGLTWLDPQPLPESVPALYAEYFSQSPEASSAGNSRRAGMRALALRRLGYDVPVPALPLWLRAAARTGLVDEMLAADVLYLPPVNDGTVLDVGCGSGELLGNLQQLGWSVTGIEPEPASAAAAAQRLGASVIATDLEHAALPHDHYDVVILNHVIEHLTDPIAALRTCAATLKPGGRAIIATPNTASLGQTLFRNDWLHWDAPRHLYTFNARGLRALLERAGLRVVQQRTLARKARWAWQASTMIRRGQRPTHAPAQSTAEKLGAWLFQIVEHTAARVSDIGEELYAVATR